MEIIFLHYDAWEIILLRQLLLRHLVVFVLLDVPIYVEKGFGEAQILINEIPDPKIFSRLKNKISIIFL